MIPRLVPKISPCDGFCDGAGGGQGHSSMLMNWKSFCVSCIVNFTLSFLPTQSLTRPPQLPAAVRQGPSTSPLKCLPSSKCLPRLATQSYTSVCEFCCCYPATSSLPRTSATQRRLPGASLGCTQTNLAPIQTYESFSSQTLFALFRSI